MESIGKIVATEKKPTTIDSFSFWTQKDMNLKPFDVVVVQHIKDSVTYGVIEEISHITDSPSYLAGYISSDFGDVNQTSYTDRLGMNFVQCRVVGNDKDIYTPALDGASVSLADDKQIKAALGLDKIENPLPAGYIEMYEGKNKQIIPVHFNSKFLIGPEGAHLNISGMSGLASKTSYAMFLMKAIQDMFLKQEKSADEKESVAFIMLNVKGRDLLAIDELNEKPGELQEIYSIYEDLKLDKKPFENVKYFFPYSEEITTTTYANKEDAKALLDCGRAYQYKYIFEDDKENLDLLFADIDDPNDTIESIVNYILNGQGEFRGVSTWEQLKDAIDKQTQKGGTASGKEITWQSWNRFKRLLNKSIGKNKSLFANALGGKTQISLKNAISDIKKNDVFVIDVAKLDGETQGFVFGDVMRTVWDLRNSSDREDGDLPKRIIIFVDELNKYASSEIPKNSPILKQLLDITERGRQQGIVLFGAEQFISDIHKRIKGNCATLAYGRTNVIEISKGDFQFVPPVYKSMLTRLKQGEYIIQNPVFRSLLNIKFPKPIYKQD